MILNSRLTDESMAEKYYSCEHERSEDTDIPRLGNNCSGHDTYDPARGVADLL